MTPWKKNLSLIFLLVLGLFLFWWMEVKNEKVKAPDAPSLFPLGWNSLTKMELMNGGESPIRFQRNSQGVFESPDLNGVINPDFFSLMAHLFSRLKIHQEFSVETLTPPDLEKTGLSSPTLLLNVEWKSGEKWQLALGSLNRTGDFLYLLKNQKQVILSDKNLLPSLKRWNRTNLIDNSLARFSTKEVKKITIQWGGDPPLILEKSLNNEIFLKEPFLCLADFLRVSEFIEFFYRIEKVPLLKNFKEISPEVAGLSPPKLSIRFESYSGKDLFWIRIGNHCPPHLIQTDPGIKGEQMVFASEEKDKSLFLLPLKFLAGVPQNPEGFLNLSLESFYRNFSYQSGDFHLVQGEPHGYLKVASGPMNGRQVKAMEIFKILKKLHLTEIEKGGVPLDSLASFTLKPYLSGISDWNKRFNYYLGSSSGSFFLFREEENLLFKITEKSLEEVDRGIREWVFSHSTP